MSLLFWNVHMLLSHYVNKAILSFEEGNTILQLNCNIFLYLTYVFTLLPVHDFILKEYGDFPIGVWVDPLMGPLEVRHYTYFV